MDRIADAPQALWIAAFAIYALDVARRIETGELLLVASGSRLRPILARVPLEFGGKELYVASLLAPWQAVLTARWDERALPGASLLQDLQRRLSALRPLRPIAALVFLLVFVAGPVLTQFVGLGAALLLIVPLVYAANAIAAALLWLRRDAAGLSRAQAGWLIADALLCAPYGANWVKRVARRWPPVAGGWLGLSEQVAAADRERMESTLAARREEGGPTPEAPAAPPPRGGAARTGKTGSRGGL